MRVIGSFMITMDLISERSGDSIVTISQPVGISMQPAHSPIDGLTLIPEFTPVSACAPIRSSWNPIPSDLDPAGFLSPQPLFGRPDPGNKVCESSEALWDSLETKEEQTVGESWQRQVSARQADDGSRRWSDSPTVRPKICEQGRRRRQAGRWSRRRSWGVTRRGQDRRMGDRQIYTQGDGVKVSCSWCFDLAMHSAHIEVIS